MAWAYIGKRVWDKSAKIQALAAQANYQTEGACRSQRALIGALVAFGQTTRVVPDYAAMAG